MDPSSHRPTCKKLAKLTKGRCLSVRYRLAPQSPFPSALLDALLSYLSLLYPAPDSFHAPVSPEHIVFAGDSAGGNLCMVLLQTLLSLRHQGLKIRWNGHEREIPLPAGVATCSPWLDITHSSPSCESNARFDYLPARTSNPAGMTYPADEIWPAKPPRKNLYAEDAMLCHPLVSPLGAASWAGSCPLFVQVGHELLTDEGKHVAAKAAGQGVGVVFEEYEAMPHCFAMVLGELPTSKRFFGSWAGFAAGVVEGKSVQTRGTMVRAKTGREEELDVRSLREVGDEVVLARMKEQVEKMSGKQPDSMSKL